MAKFFSAWIGSPWALVAVGLLLGALGGSNLVAVADCTSCNHNVYMPVCGLLNDGSRGTFLNDCTARCDSRVVSTTAGVCTSCEQACPTTHSPVCALLKTGKRQTFANKCMAECDARVDTSALMPLGVCKIEGGCQICATGFSPVCATLGNGTRTLIGNACGTSCAPAVVSYTNGPCASPASCPGTAERCPPSGTPVCALMVDGTRRTFSNACQADCTAGVHSHKEGECNGAKCPAGTCAWTLNGLVCGALRNGTRVTITNSCFADCNPEVVSHRPDPCVIAPASAPCKCPTTVSPVCARRASGELVTYPNRCQAKCDQLVDKNAIMSGSCKPACSASCQGSKAILDPMCLLRQDARRAVPVRSSLTFPNPCFASCQGGAKPSTALYYKGKCTPGCDATCNIVNGTQLSDFKAKYGAKAEGRVCCGNAKEYPSLCYASCAGGLNATELEQCQPGYCVEARAEALLRTGTPGLACALGCPISAPPSAPPCSSTTPECTAAGVKCATRSCPGYFRFEFVDRCKAHLLNPKNGSLVTSC